MRLPDLSSLFAFALILAASLPGRSSAQRMEAGVGWGPTSDGRVSGTGLYARFTVPTGLTIAGAEVEVTVVGTRGSASGSYLSCEQVQKFYCTGRRDAHTTAGVGIGARFYMPGAWRERGWYFLLPGPSILRRATESVEHQAPTGFCFDGTDLISCPDNPPYQTFRLSGTEWAFGLTSGVGFAFTIADVPGFIEARPHTTWDTRFKRSSGHLPFLVGVRF